MSGSTDEVRFDSLGTFLYLVFAVLSTKSGNGPVRLQLKDRRARNIFFAVLKEKYGKDFEVLGSVQFAEDDFPSPTSYSERLEETIAKLSENGGILQWSEKELILGQLGTTSAWMQNQLNRAFGGNVAKRLRFDELVCEFRQVLSKD